jgi:palmitoyltransferase
MLEKTNTLTRKQRVNSFITEYDEIFDSISANDINKISQFILNKDNKIWEIKKPENLTVLHNACALDKTDVIITIIEKTKIRLGLDNKSNITSEEKSQNEKIFKDFINEQTEGDNQTALHYASFRGNIKIIKLLIANHADINSLTHTGYNMIHKAAMGNKPSAIIYFNKKYNMSLEDTDENQMNALHLAVRNGMENSVIFLLSLGLNPNFKDKDGNTALHYAVKKSNSRIIKKLLQRGADRNIPDFKYKMTPVMLARNNVEIIEIFREKRICEKLFFKPDISKKTLCSNKNMILFIVLHLVIILLVFFILLPYFNSNIFSSIYIIISAFVFILYISLSFSNPGKMINNEYNDLLDIVEKGNDAEDFCPYCLVKNNFRSKHCLICQNCIDEFDHHCFWVGNCIGKNNYKLFFIFLIYILLNTLYNIGVNIYYLATEIGTENIQEDYKAFPGFYFGNCFLYNNIFRIIVSISIFIICILFFIPLFNLFRMQLNTALEKRQIRIDEEEYERMQLREKLDDEVWEDLKFDESQEVEKIEMNLKLCDFERESTKT